jgi:hypothetical protein
MISLKRSSLHCVSGEPRFLSPQCSTYLGGVHLVDGDDELPDTKGESEQSVLSGLAILGDTSLEFTSASGNDEDSAISLGGTSDHVLDEITVSRSINDLDSLRVNTVVGR